MNGKYEVRRLTPFRIISFGIGNAGISIVNFVVQSWLFYFLVPGTGRVLIPAAYIGAVLMFGRVVDAVADPLIGNWSDRLRSKHGRRMPFLIFSALPLSLNLFLLFYEPVYGDSLMMKIILLAALLGSFYFLFTAFAAPYYGMIPDLSGERKDRVNLSTSAAVFNLLGTGIALVGAPMLIEQFTGGTGFEGFAFVPSMAILSVLALVAFLVCIVGMFPLRNRGSGAVESNLLASLKMVVKNKPFLIYLFGMNIFWGGFFIINVSIPYYVTVLMKKPIGFQSVAMGLTFGVAFLSFPFINLLMKRFGNRLVAIGCSGMLGVLLIFIYFIPDSPFGLSPQTFGLMLMGFSGLPIAGIFVLPQAMIAELSDFTMPDGSKPGEAIYFGVQGLVMKFFIGIVSLVTSLLYQFFGNTPQNPLGILLTGPIVSIFALFAVIMFLFYPDDRKGLFNSDVVAMDVKI